MSENLIELIKNVKLLEGLNEKQLLRFAEKCKVSSFEKGETIIRAGDLTKDLYILITGICSVEVDVTKDVKHFVVEWVNPGDVFGEMGFFDGKPRSATVVCKESSKVVAISAQNFKELINKESDIGIAIMKNMALIFVKKIRGTHSKFKNLYWKGLVTTKSSSETQNGSL